MTSETAPPSADFEAVESAVRSYCRDMPAVFARASNARVWDEAGTEYIDFLSGCGSLNYGHNHPEMKARIVDYLAGDGIVNALDLHTRAKRDFIREFRDTILIPRDLDYRIQFTGPTGANAVEAALKLARKVTGRRSVVAFTNAFHGMSLGALAAGARQYHHRSAGIDLDGVVRLPFENYCGAGLRELDCFEAMVGDPSGGVETPAAFIVETIQGEGGLNVASPAWLQHLAGAARRLGALLIVDDVQAGCGRTGTFFSFERAQIAPDVVCLAKSISGIGLPMAMVLIRPEHDLWAPGEHNGTFRGNNLAFVAATVAARFWRDAAFLHALDSSIAALQDWTRSLAHELGPEQVSVKGLGMFAGLCFADKSLARRAAAEAFRRNVLIETSGPHAEVLKLLPPLTIDGETLDQGLKRLRAAILAALSGDRLRFAA